MKIRFIKVLIILISFSPSLYAQDYLLGVKYFENKEYVKAFPIILTEAEKGVNKAAQYRLALMYENGLGTDVDFKKSLHWYKKAASKYAYVEEKKADNQSVPFTEKLSSQFTNKNIEAGNEFTLTKMDTNTPETKSLSTKGFFGLAPYRTNYFLPISYSVEKPNRVSSVYGHNGLPSEYSQYGNNTEITFQLSLKKQLTYNLFGFNESIYSAYTQKAWWQFYDKSGPFREINHQAELFVNIPTTQTLDDSIGLKAIKLGFIHESNGQEGYRSRSWNRLYATGIWQWDNLFLSTRAWYRLKEDRKPDWYYQQSVNTPEAAQQYSGDDDNPDIADYIGYGDIELSYLYGKSQFGLLLRNNLDFSENRGAVEFRYSYPFYSSENVYWYTKIFNGYGESLIDYNENVTKASFGFSFSGGVFK